MSRTWVAEIRRLQAQIDALTLSLDSSSPSTDTWQSAGATLTFNDSVQSVGWSTATSPPSWAAITFSTLSIIEPGLYALYLKFTPATSPTTGGHFMMADVGWLTSGECIPLDPLFYGGASFGAVSSSVDLLVVSTDDIASGPFTVSQNVYCPTDATATVHVNAFVTRVLIG